MMSALAQSLSAGPVDVLIAGALINKHGVVHCLSYTYCNKQEIHEPRDFTRDLGNSEESRHLLNLLSN